VNMEGAPIWKCQQSPVSIERTRPIAICVFITSAFPMK
jgi:hypothetical protein